MREREATYHVKLSYVVSIVLDGTETRERLLQILAENVQDRINAAGKVEAYPDINGFEEINDCETCRDQPHLGILTERRIGCRIEPITVERCDACERYESDEAARSALLTTEGR